MAGILDGVDRRTQLAGQNRLEMLLFGLGDKQRFGINVFKVQEVIPCPDLTKVPHTHPLVMGVANMRGRSIMFVDLAAAIGRAPVRDTAGAYAIVTEYNRSVQAFVVSNVERIVNVKWEDILPPPHGSGSHYMTAVTKIDGKLVEIIDVEKVLSEVVPASETVSREVAAGAESRRQFHALVADDSSVARRQIQHTLEQLGVEMTIVSDGAQALKQLQEWAQDDRPIADHVDLVISDVEMPKMDGYALTSSIRQDPKLRDLFIILHTSLSGIFNNALVQKVGADQFIPKFDPDDLAEAVSTRIRAIGEET